MTTKHKMYVGTVSGELIAISKADAEDILKHNHILYIKSSLRVAYRMENNLKKWYFRMYKG